MEEKIIEDFFNSVLTSDIEKEIMILIVKDLPEDETVEKLLEFILAKSKSSKSSKKEISND